MHYKLYSLLAGTLLCSGSLAVTAQTVSTFDDLSLPGPDTSFAATQPPGDYSFQSGNVLFYGNLASWGGYSGFNYSNVTDNTTPGYTNDKSAITGTGYDSSANYGIGFINLDFMGPDPAATIPVGAALKNNAAGHPVLGAYITNTTYAYNYMITHFHPGDWFRLTVRGYLNGQPSADSVNFMLAEITDTSNVVVDNWKWMDLTLLGPVDSLTFDVHSSDTAGGMGMNNPAYFAIDNLITTNGDECPDPAHLAASGITTSGAQVSWTGADSVHYEYALDQTAAPAPGSAGSVTADTQVAFSGLEAGTTYYFHIRTLCTFQGISYAAPWDTLSFKTTNETGIIPVAGKPLQCSVSPNPAQDRVYIHADQPVAVLLFNLQGKMLFQKATASELDLSGLAPGIYLLKVVAPNRQPGIIKLVKQ